MAWTTARKHCRFTTTEDISHAALRFTTVTASTGVAGRAVRLPSAAMHSGAGVTTAAQQRRGHSTEIEMRRADTLREAAVTAECAPAPLATTGAAARREAFPRAG